MSDAGLSGRLCSSLEETALFRPWCAKEQASKDQASKDKLFSFLYEFCSSLAVILSSRLETRGKAVREQQLPLFFKKVVGGFARTATFCETIFASFASYHVRGVRLSTHTLNVT